MIIVLSGDGQMVSNDIQYFHSIINDTNEVYILSRSIISNMDPSTKRLIDKNVGLTYRNKWALFYDTEIHKILYHVTTNQNNDGYKYTDYIEKEEGETMYYTPGIGISNKLLL